MSNQLQLKLSAWEPATMADHCAQCGLLLVSSDHAVHLPPRAYHLSCFFEHTRTAQVHHADATTSGPIDCSQCGLVIPSGSNDVYLWRFTSSSRIVAIHGKCAKHAAGMLSELDHHLYLNPVSYR